MNDQFPEGFGIEEFSNEAHSVVVELYPAKDAKLVWLNESLARLDPIFAELNGNMEDYREHILKSCAFRPVSKCVSAESDCVLGAADRYGGQGLAGNGGAGRAAFVNGYYVKGIGRTMLLGSGEEISHASGDCYLEEAVREAIFGEIMAAELPHSAIRTLAIISLNEHVHWHEVNKSENLVLSVRPRFLRLGHLARALCFRSSEERNGDLDERRVSNAFACLSKIIENSSIGVWIKNIHLLVADQLSYCFAHRITQGSPTLSNWAINLSLLDFGASTTLPSYKTAIISPIGTGVRYVEGLIGIYRELYHIAAYAEIYIPQTEAILEKVAEWQDEGVSRYKCNVVKELCRSAGLTSSEFDTLSTEELENISIGIDRLLLREGQRQFDLIKNPDARGEIIDYKEKLEIIFSRSIRNYTSRNEETTLIQTPRAQLFREDAKKKLYAEVDPFADVENEFNTRPIEENVSKTISKWIANNRRDTKVTLWDRMPIGFAVSPSLSIALFSYCNSIYGIDETTPTMQPKLLADWMKQDEALVVSASVEFEESESGEKMSPDAFWLRASAIN